MTTYHVDSGLKDRLNETGCISAVEKNAKVFGLVELGAGLK